LFFRIITIYILKKIIPRRLFKINKSIIARVVCGFISFLYRLIIVFIIISIVHSFYLPYLFRSELNSSNFAKFVATDPVGMNKNFEKIFGDIVIVATDSLEAISDQEEGEVPMSLGWKVFDVKINENMENEMLALVNDERKSRGIEPLVMDEKMRAVARAYGTDMFARGFFGHTDLDGNSPSDRMKRGEVRFIASGENLALQPNLFSAHDGLMKSDNHRKNILHFYFHRIGIGVIDGGEKGIIFVQNFAD